MKQVRYALIMVAGLSVAAAAMTRSNSAGPSGLENRVTVSGVQTTQTTAATGTPVAVSSPSPASQRIADLPEATSMLLLGGSLVFLAGLARRGLFRRA